MQNQENGQPGCGDVAETTSGEGEYATDSMAWALCPVLLASEECDIPQIAFGPHPECLECSLNGWPHHGSASGCRIVAEVAARIALGLPQLQPVNPGTAPNTDSHPNTVAVAPGEAGRG